MKKIFGFVFVLNLLFTQSSSAALIAPADALSDKANIPATGQQFNINAVQPEMSNQQSMMRRVMPCSYSQMAPTGNAFYRCLPSNYAQSVGLYSSEFGSWLMLMVVITLVLVWVTLLLLIALLWRLLKKHRRA